MNKIIISLLIGLLASFNAMADWTVKLEGTVNGATSSPIHFGEFLNALDGYDRIYDGPAFPGTGVVNLFFERAVWGRTEKVYWYDIKSVAPLQQWEFDVTSRRYYNDLTLHWDLSRLPDNYTITLGDGIAEQVIDMRAQSTYTYTYSGPRRFLVTVEQVILEMGPGRGGGPDINRLPSKARVPDVTGSGYAHGLENVPSPLNNP